MKGGPLIVLAGTLAAVVFAGGARAQDKVHASSQPLLFQSDEVQYDQELGLTVAKGHVEIDEQDQILLADTVTYNQKTDTVIATGHVNLLQPTGDIIFAEYMELHDNLRDGFIKDIRILLSDRSRMAGNTGRRVNGNRTEIKRGVYSPCELCKDDPTKPPVWQIKAADIVHDKDLQTIEYRDAVMELDGWPIMYFPYLSHPDPTVKRASGFLPPTFGSGNNLGFHTITPYFWAIDTDKDVTFRPIITTNAGVVLDQTYRQVWGFGKLNIDGSLGFGDNAPTGPIGVANNNSGSASIRGHILGSGQFDLTPDTRTGFEAQRVSDLAYLPLYHFQQPTNFMTSHVYAENFSERSYGNVSAYSFQSLNTVVGDGVQPIVLPAANYEWTSDADRIGGRLRLTANALNFERHSGSDMRRVSAGSEWRLPFNGPIGDRYTFAVSARADGYDSSNVLVAPTDTTLHDGANGRIFPQASLGWRYPWVRHDPGTSEMIEPMAAIVAAPNGSNPRIIPNEDSQGFEFDETSLFRPNRLPGYDRVDSGQRVDYGINLGVFNGNYGSSNFIVGQSYRLQQQSAFQFGSGLDHRLSDVVGRILISPVNAFDLFYRYRLDHADLAMKRQEAGLTAGPASLRGSISFISIKPVPGLSPISTGDQISLLLQADLTRYWSARFYDTRNIGGGGTTVNSGVDLTYRDDCFAITTSVQQSGISIGEVRSGLTMMVTLVFKNLGEVNLHTLSAQY